MGKNTSWAQNPDHGSQMPNMQYNNFNKKNPKTGGGAENIGNVQSFLSFSFIPINRLCQIK